MLKTFSRILCLIIFLPITVFATDANSATSSPTFQEGKDYELVTPAANAPTLDPKKVTVMEFFSYGCPWCFHFDPYLEKWLATKPADVDFQRVPVVFQPAWDMYARAYYTAKDLGIENKITPAIFKAIQTDGQDLTTQGNLEQFFVSQGVKPSDFESAFNFSPGIDAQMMKGDNLMRAYNIFEVPTLVIDGKYKTNVRMTKGDNDKLLQVLNYLIGLEKKSQAADKK